MRPRRRSTRTAPTAPPRTPPRAPTVTPKRPPTPRKKRRETKRRTLTARRRKTSTARRGRKTLTRKPRVKREKVSTPELIPQVCQMPEFFTILFSVQFCFHRVCDYKAKLMGEMVRNIRKMVENRAEGMPIKKLRLKNGLSLVTIPPMYL